MRNPRTPHFKLTQLSYAIGLCFVAGSAFSQANSNANLVPINVEVVEVSQPFSTQIQSNVDNEQFKATGAQNIDDIVMYDPSIDVRSDNMRTGHFGYNIRGIVHSRVQSNVDGVPMVGTYREPAPEDQVRTLNKSRIHKYGTDVIETETLKQVEIDKVGNSAVYGNGGLGGAVNMTTYQPSDFVNEKKPFAAALRYGYRSTYDSHSKTAIVAGYSPFAEGLLMLTQRDSKQAKNFADNDENGRNKTTSNHQKNVGNNILAKVNFTHGNHRLELTFEHFNRKVKTTLSELINDRILTGTNASRDDKVAEYSGKDNFKRDRINAVYRYLPTSDWLDEITLQAYSQNLRVNDGIVRTNVSKYTTNTTPPKLFKTIDDSTYNNNISKHSIIGLRTEIKTHFTTGTLKHKVWASADLKQEKMDRDRFVDYVEKTVQLKDEEEKVTSIETHENVRFTPAIKTTSYGLTLQDYVTFSNDVGLNLALRYQQDQINFAKLEFQGKGISEQESAKLTKGIIYRTFSPSMRLSIPVNNKLTLTAGYAFAQKLPEAQFMGTGLVVGNYKVSPNPNLKPETVHNFDLGLLYQTDTLQTKVNLYYNKYKDFLAGEIVDQPADGFKNEVRYINRDRVVTYGAEIYSAWKFAKHWQLTNSLAWMKGYQLLPNQPKQPLLTALPLNGVIGLNYVTAKWGGSVKLRWADNQRDLGSKATYTGLKKYFSTPSYRVWDLTAYYKPMKNLEIRAGVFNLFNEKYWQAADVVEVTVADKLDRYTQPGRNYSLNVEVKF